MVVTIIEVAVLGVMNSALTLLVRATLQIGVDERRERLLRTDRVVRAVHEAMQNAAHDGRDFRQARAAIEAVERARRGT